MRGDPWLTLSSMGVGTYLGGEDVETDEQVASAVITSVQQCVPANPSNLCAALLLDATSVCSPALC